MQAPGDALTHWHEFYALLGTAAGTLVGLLFVAATVAAGVFPSDRQAPLRIFLSATVVHFSSVLIVSLILLAPIENWTLLGVVVLVCGLIGIAYYGLVCRDATRDGLMAAIDLEDRICTRSYRSSPTCPRPSQASCWLRDGRRVAWCLPSP